MQTICKKKRKKSFGVAVKWVKGFSNVQPTESTRLKKKNSSANLANQTDEWVGRNELTGYCCNGHGCRTQFEPIEAIQI